MKKSALLSFLGASFQIMAIAISLCGRGNHVSREWVAGVLVLFFLGRFFSGWSKEESELEEIFG